MPSNEALISDLPADGPATPQPSRRVQGLPPGETGQDTDDEAVELSQIEAEFDKGLHRLRFAPALEARFEKDSMASRISTMRTSAAWAGPVSNIFLIVDHFLVPDVFSLAVVLRLLVSAPVGMALPFLVKTLRSVGVLERAAVLVTLMTAAIHTVIVCRSQSALALTYLGGLAMVIMYSSAFLRLRFRRALFTSAAIVAMAFLGFGVMPEGLRNPAVGVPILLFIVSSAVFTLYAQYFLELEDRQNFLMGLRQRLLRADLTRTMGEVENISRVDLLTQLPNRRHFDNHLERMWKRAQNNCTSVSVLMIDVDHLKDCNEQHGSQAGDACLRAVARAIGGSLRRPGDLVARYGGDEFVAVLNHTPREQAQAAAQRIVEAVRALQAMPGEPALPPLTVSIGMANLDEVSPYDSSEACLTMAHHALCSAKRRGRDRVVVQWTESSVT